MRRRRAGTWREPLLFPEEADVSLPEEVRGQVVTALAQVLLSAGTDRSETAGGGASHESQDPA